MMIRLLPVVLVGGVAISALPLPAQLRAPAPAAMVSAAEVVPPAPTVDQWVVDEIARRWFVSPHRVEIDWGDTPARLRTRVAEGADLVGGATEGWVLALPPVGDDPARRLRIDVGLRTDVPLAAREIARGTDLTEADVTWVERVVPGPPRGAPADPVGQRARRRVATGEPLDGAAVAPAPFVTARDPVEVVYQKGAVSIALRGTALADGLPGEPVHVRLEDGRRIQGRAVAPGRISLDTGGHR